MKPNDEKTGDEVSLAMSMAVDGAPNLQESVKSLEEHVRKAYIKLSGKIEDIADINSELKEYLET